MIFVAKKMTQRNKFVYVPSVSNETLFNNFRNQGLLDIKSFTQTKEIDPDAPFVNVQTSDKVGAISTGIAMASYLEQMQSALQKPAPTEPTVSFEPSSE